MRYFAVFVAIVAVASAESVNPPRPSAQAIIAQILEAIAALKPESVAVGPAIVEDPLEGIAVGPEIVENPLEGIAVGPAIIENPLEGIAVGPAIIPFPLPDGGVVAEEPIVPSPVAIVEGPAAEAPASSPLVQIIVNVNQAAAGEASPVPVAPVVVPEIVPTPVHVVDTPYEPVDISVPIIPHPAEPVDITVPIIPHPVEPVQVGVPVFPEAAVVLPEELN